MTKKYTIEEIKKKLQWFHGEEFDKYPFIDASEDAKLELNTRI